MFEYGRGVGETSGQVPGSGGGGGGGIIGNGGPGDLGAGAVNAASDLVARVAALPPEGLLLLAAAILVGLVVLKRAF